MKQQPSKRYLGVLRAILASNPGLKEATFIRIAKEIIANAPTMGIEVTNTVEQIRKAVPTMLLNSGIAVNTVLPIKVVEEISDDYTVDIEKRKQSSREKQLEVKYGRLLVDYQELSAAFDDVLLIKDHKRKESFFETTDAQNKSEATAILQWSDWHIEEVVHPSTVMGLNKFGPEIAKQRVDTLINNTVKVLRSQRGAVDINHGIIHLGGDFITGYLREHDMQDNAMTPIEAIIYAKELLIGAIDFMVDHSGFKEILFICNRGNHPRLTPKMQPSNDYKMNLEALLYHMLEKHYASNPNLRFEVPDSPIGMVTHYGKRIRFFHGHEIQYKDGVGGLSIPLNKKLQKWDSTLQADFNLLGHYHQCFKPLKTCMMNGSLVGYNAYALSGGFSYEPPMQSFQLLDRQRGFTLHTTIACE